MKKLFFILLSVLFLSLPTASFAIYDPLGIPNNIFGIHILFPQELSEASSLVNSTGGDWGYVTIPIQANDRNLDKWQKFMDDCRKYHLIPIVRLATTGDYFVKSSWSVPNDNEVLDFANFLNSLNWPTKNRYIVVFNEPNRGDEWGGTPDANAYAQILDYASHIFKQRNQDFFIISAGLDNASANLQGQSIDDFTFMQEMNDAVPGIFGEIDGIASHSYPNPGFSNPPSLAQEGVDSFYYQRQLALSLSGKYLPVFITETGWSTDAVSDEQQAIYYKETFQNYWNDKSIVAVTPFLLDAGPGPFAQFSFIKTGNKTQIYSTYSQLPKVKGEPVLNPVSITAQFLEKKLPTEKFKNTLNYESVFKTVNKSAISFFKWILNP